MYHIMQPNRWSCSVASAAMVMGIDVKTLTDEIGHDGSRIVFPDLREPTNRAGFTITEIIDAAFKLGWSVVGIETMPQATPDGHNVRDVYPESKLRERVDHYLDSWDAIAYGARHDGLNWHVIAWSHKEQRWHDPSGPILQKEKPSIRIAVIYVFTRNENHAFQRLLSSNS